LTTTVKGLIAVDGAAMDVNEVNGSWLMKEKESECPLATAQEQEKMAWKKVKQPYNSKPYNYLV